MEFAFTWGDCVKVAESAPANLRPGARAAIVGLDDRADQPAYTVEFGDGSDAEIAETMLEACPDDS